jgi:hypothetical protein
MSTDVILNVAVYSIPIPVAAASKAWVYVRSLAGIAVSNSAGHGCLSLVIYVCCQADVSATGRSLVQRSPTERGVSEFDLETSTVKSPRHTKTVEP